MRSSPAKGVVAVVLAIATLTIISQAHYLVSFAPNVAAVISSVLVELTNHDRTSQGLGTLTVSPLLNEVALAKAEHMAKNQYFAHTAPTGETPWYWFKEKGYQFSYAGENLAIDFYESPDVERAWMQSPTHRANIVGTQFTEIGIAVVPGMYQGHATNYVVQVFGTPAPKAIATPVSKPTPPAPRPVREVAGTSTPQTVAVATTLPQPKPVTDVLGESAGSYLSTASVTWWFKFVHYFVR